MPQRPDHIVRATVCAVIHSEHPVFDAKLGSHPVVTFQHGVDAIPDAFVVGIGAYDMNLIGSGQYPVV